RPPGAGRPGGLHAAGAPGRAHAAAPAAHASHGGGGARVGIVRARASAGPARDDG
ncbi:unnamed protein product, partial [Prorocentrum cordatum]